MASTTTTTHSYTDDASHVEAVTLSTDESGKAVEAGANLPAGQRVYVTLTDGETVWKIDTNRSGALAAFLKASGAKQKRKGRKASAK